VTQCMVRVCIASEKPSREDRLSPKFEWPAKSHTRGTLLRSQHYLPTQAQEKAGAVSPVIS
jgi:hypothetical protein